MYPDKLYQLAFAFRKAKLWKSLFDSELFAVTLPDGEVGYCCVMGAAGEHLALALYVGSSGLDSYRLLQEVGDMDVTALKVSEVMLSQECLQCSFENKDMLTPEELSAVRAYASEHRLALRGANAFPQFISYHPAAYPWPVSDQGEIRLLCAALEAALEVGERLKSEDKLRLGFREGPAHDRSLPLLTRSGEGYAWSLHPLPPRQPVRYPEPALNNDLLLARLRKAKRRSGVWACDLVLMPQPYMDEDTSVPVFPYTLLVFDYKAELALPTDAVHDLESGSEALLRALGNQMLEHGIPKEIRVVDERTYALLKNLASALKIRLVLEEENELLDEMEADFLEYAGEQTEDPAGAALAEMLLTLDDDSLLSIPDALWEQLCSLERQGMLDEAVAQRLRVLSKRKR